MKYHLFFLSERRLSCNLIISDSNLSNRRTPFESNQLAIDRERFTSDVLPKDDLYSMQRWYISSKRFKHEDIVQTLHYIEKNVSKALKKHKKKDLDLEN